MAKIIKLGEQKEKQWFIPMKLYDWKGIEVVSQKEGLPKVSLKMSEDMGKKFLVAFSNIEDAKKYYPDSPIAVIQEIIQPNKTENERT